MQGQLCRVRVEMQENQTSFELTLAVAFGLSSAQAGLISGLYQISSGSYNECCGIAGEIDESLPNPYQVFIELTH
jgi:hypothetical protein